MRSKGNLQVVNSPYYGYSHNYTYQGAIRWKRRSDNVNYHYMANHQIFDPSRPIDTSTEIKERYILRTINESTMAAGVPTYFREWTFEPNMNFSHKKSTLPILRSESTLKLRRDDSRQQSPIVKLP